MVFIPMSFPLSGLLFLTKCFFWSRSSSNFCLKLHGLHLSPLPHSFFRTLKMIRSCLLKVSNMSVEKKIILAFLASLVCGNNPKLKELSFWIRKNPTTWNVALLPPSSYLESFVIFFPIWIDVVVLLYHFFPFLSPTRGHLRSLSVNRAPSSGNR